MADKIDQKQVVRGFVESLGKITPALITTDLFENYIKNIVVDSESMEEFIAYADRFLKHSQTFQLGFLLHSLASVLTMATPGGPLLQVKLTIKTDSFRIPYDDIVRMKDLPEALRYDKLCEKLIEPQSPEAKSMDARIVSNRENKEKIDDGTPANALFDPMKVMFAEDHEPGQDMSEKTEV